MKKYYVNENAQTNGDHEVHVEGCAFAPLVKNRIDLGYHFSCFPAVSLAKKTYSRANGCYYCCNQCHTS